jgi:hypothetical protein
VLLGIANETLAFGFLNLLKKPINHHFSAGLIIILKNRIRIYDF